MVKVNLQYFKDNGTYYSSGSYMTDKKSMYDIRDEIEKMNKDKKLPDIQGSWSFIHVEVDSSYNTNWDYPVMVLGTGVVVL